MMILISNGPNMIQVLPDQPLYGSLRCGEGRQLRPLPRILPCPSRVPFNLFTAKDALVPNLDPGILLTQLSAASCRLNRRSPFTSQLGQNI